MNIKEICKIYGVENVKITMGCIPIRQAFLLLYTCSDDEEIMAEFSISEERYKVSDGYKIGFLPVKTEVGDVLSPHDFYQSDLEALIHCGRASVRVIIPEQIA